MSCRLEEIAAHFAVPVSELKAFLQATPEARAAMKRGYDADTQRLQRSRERLAGAARNKSKKPDSRSRRTAARGASCQILVPAQTQRSKISSRALG